MAGTPFDRLLQEVLQEILRQQRLMEALQEENRELHRQLADLHEARGISVDVCGKRFALLAASPPAPAQAPPIPVLTASGTAVPLVSVPAGSAAQETPASHDARAEVAETPTLALPVPSGSASQLLEEEEASIRTFLEELMMDEFAAASTPSPGPPATGSPPAPKQQSMQEEEGATLRRQLIGSFLLE
jgi:hypothetical protein